jgi:hypothetical protein
VRSSSLLATTASNACRMRRRSRIACERASSPPSAFLARPCHPRGEVPEGDASRRGTPPGHRYRAPQTPRGIGSSAGACAATTTTRQAVTEPPCLRVDSYPAVSNEATTIRGLRSASSRRPGGTDLVMR